MYGKNLIPTYQAVKMMYRKLGIPLKVTTPDKQKLNNIRYVDEYSQKIIDAIKNPHFHYLLKGGK